MLTAFVAGVNAFFAFFGFMLMLFVALGVLTAIVLLCDMLKTGKNSEE